MFQIPRKTSTLSKLLAMVSGSTRSGRTLRISIFPFSDHPETFRVTTVADPFGGVLSSTFPPSYQAGILGQTKLNLYLPTARCVVRLWASKQQCTLSSFLDNSHNLRSLVPGIKRQPGNKSKWPPGNPGPMYC